MGEGNILINKHIYIVYNPRHISKINKACRSWKYTSCMVKLMRLILSILLTDLEAHDLGPIDSNGMGGGVESNGMAKNTGHLSLWDIVPVFSK